MTLSAHNRSGTRKLTETRSKLSSDSRDFQIHGGLSFAELCNLDAKGNLCQREGGEADISSKSLQFEDRCDWRPSKIDSFTLQNFSDICEHSCIVRNARRKAKINNAPSSNFRFSTKCVGGSGTETKDAWDCDSSSWEPKGQKLGLLAKGFNLVACSDSGLQS